MIGKTSDGLALLRPGFLTCWPPYHPACGDRLSARVRDHVTAYLPRKDAGTQTKCTFSQEGTPGTLGVLWKTVKLVS